MKKVYVINGPAGTGKDTLIYIFRQFTSGALNVRTFSAVDEVKRYLIEHEGWDGITKDAFWRNRMYEVKMEMVANGDRPTTYLYESAYATPDNSVVFLHIREPQEIVKILRRIPEAETIHLDSTRVERFDNPADSQTSEFEYNHYLRNDGSLEDFIEVVRQFILSQEAYRNLGLGEQMTFGEVK